MYSEHIGKRLSNVSNRIRRYIDNETSTYGVTHMQSMIIRFLIHQADNFVYQRDIEKEFGIRRSSVTSILQLMEKNGFITRISDENDARLKRILLTEVGICAEEKVHNIIHSTEEKLSKSISAKQKKELFSLLDKLECCLIGLEAEEKR